MQVFVFLFMLTGVVPLASALVANRRHAIHHALIWAAFAWCTWLTASAFLAFARDNSPLRYLALCLTGCAAIAVLGARRPHVGAWNAVIAALLAVMLLPLLEGALLGSETFDLLRIVLLAGTILMGVVNYLPTRFAPAAITLGLACGSQLILMDAQIAQRFDNEMLILFADACLAITPWLALATWAVRRTPARGSDALWQSFRDRFGLFWALRVREQFNRAAANSGWSAHLTWTGLQGDINSEQEAAIEKTAHALLQRFNPESTINTP